MSRDAKLLLASSALAGVGNGLFSTVYQLYLDELGYTGAGVGALSALSGPVAASLGLAAGFLADAYGRKRLVLAGTAVGSLAAAFLALSSEFPVLAASFLLFGVAMALHMPFSALFSLTVEREVLDAAFTTLFIFNVASRVVGNMLGFVPPMIRGHVGGLAEAYRLTFAIPAALTAASLIPLALVKEEKGAVAGKVEFKVSGSVLKFSAITALLAFGAGASIWMISYYFTEKFGVESAEIGLVFSISGLTMIPASAAAPALSARVGTLAAVVALQLASTPLLLAIAYSTQFAVAAALYIARTVLMNMANPLVSSLQMKLVREDERARMSAFTSVAWQLASSAGMATGGYLMDVWIEYPLHLTAALYAAHSVLLYALFRGSVRQLRRPS